MPIHDYADDSAEVTQSKHIVDPPGRENLLLVEMVADLPVCQTKGTDKASEKVFELAIQRYVVEYKGISF